MKLGTLLALSFCAVVAAPGAYATATLQFIVDGGVTTTCVDGAACDINPVAGAITFSGALTGGFTLNVTTGLTKPFYTGPYVRMDLNSLNVEATGAHTLRIGFADNGFTTPGNFSGSFGGTVNNGGSVIYSATYDTNALGLLFQPGATLIDTTLSLSGPFSGTLSGPGPGSAPFVVNQYLFLTTTKAGKTTFSGDFELNNVPELTSISLLGTALFLIGSVFRRKIRQNKQIS